MEDIDGASSSHLSSSIATAMTGQQPTPKAGGTSYLGDTAAQQRRNKKKYHHLTQNLQEQSMAAVSIVTEIVGEGSGGESESGGDGGNYGERRVTALRHRPLEESSIPMDSMIQSQS